MLFVLISILIMVALFDRATRLSRMDLLLLEKRFKLFALRDELRQGVIDGTMPNNKWFDYLDTSLTKAIDLLPTITVWQTLALLVRYKDDEEIMGAHATLLEAFSEEENRQLAPVYGKFVVYIAELLYRRHIGIRYGMTALVKVVRGARGFRKKAAEIITVAPETSTFNYYAHQ